MLVRDWTITSHFEGKQSLEKFEEAKHNQDFDVTFSDKRERTEGDHLDGTAECVNANETPISFN